MSQQQDRRDADMAQSAAALERAARKAREVAEQTHTPLVIYRDGKVEKQMVTTETPSSDT